MPSHSPETLNTILDSLDALVYVSDMDTYELLYMNAYGRRIWGDPNGQRCWEVIQSGQQGPCEFCNNGCLLDRQGQPADVQVWEFKNTTNNRWYQCRDQAITWSDGRLVRMEIATDITELKALEQELEAARKLAENLAHTDELTNLYNRRAFFSLGQQLLKRPRDYHYPMTALLFDIDHFKKINDSHGHAVGDQVLAQVSQTLAGLIRQEDIFARIGGEEFALLMPGTSHSQALQLAERLRASVESLRFQTANGTFNCTASFGIATSDLGETLLDNLVSQADQAMYQAKLNGRNCVVSAPSQ